MTLEISKVLLSMDLGFVGGGEVYPDVPTDLHLEGDALVFTESGSSATVEGDVRYEVPLKPEQKAVLEKALS